MKESCKNGVNAWQEFLNAFEWAIKAPSMKMYTGKYLLFVFISHKSGAFPVVKQS